MSRHGPGDFHGLSTPLEVAFTQLGVKESAPNRGNRIDEYIVSGGLDPTAGSYPWCYLFVRWCCRQVGVWMPRTASVKRAWEMGEDLRVPDPSPGDVAIHLNADGTGHCGFHMRWVSDNYAETIEGNSNREGSREGDSVVIKVRPSSYWHGWLRPRMAS